ncbi:Isopentenyl-diphosphate delta-isomerase [uncultured archaeon]|nr:Isopentenyl-diphosphate delta-isomerase [uncultured archaeon]
MTIEERKKDHIRIAVKNAVETGNPGFDKLRLKHKVLPEANYDSVDTSTTFLKHKLKAPILISGMTGGTNEARQINKALAAVAQEYGIAFGVGSERAAIEKPKLAPTYQVRDVAPDILLIANLGAVQLNYGYGTKEIRQAIEIIQADAIALHANPIQESVQPEGDRNFSNLTAKINAAAKELKEPVLFKGVGEGISKEAAQKLKVDAFDVGGWGGTNWGLIEGYRQDEATLERGRLFSSWGTSTVDSILAVRDLGVPVVGSGGVRTGVDAAKALALGADLVGLARPILTAYFSGGQKEVKLYINRFIAELKVSMFLTGAESVKGLRGRVDLV